MRAATTRASRETQNRAAELPTAKALASAKTAATETNRLRAMANTAYRPRSIPSKGMFDIAIFRRASTEPRKNSGSARGVLGAKGARAATANRT